MEEKNLPLEGIKVVEIAAVVAAPTAGRMLAYYGADVIKAETVGGDGLRIVGTSHHLPTSPGNNPLFDNFNAGKRLTAIDLKHPEGRQVLLKLLESADVFIANTRMRSLEKLGLDYESLKERFPRLIYAHFSGYGLKGEEKDRPGYDATALWMRSGAVGDAGLEGQFPLRPPYAFGDIATAGYFLSGILAALVARDRTGRGTRVETSLLNGGIWLNGPYVICTQPAYGYSLPRGRYEPRNPFSDCYLCSDGVYICPTVKNYTSDRKMLARVFEMPELAEDPDLESIAVMTKAGKVPAVTSRLEEVIRQKTSQEWCRILMENDIPNERLFHSYEVAADRQAWANGYLEMVSYPDAETAVPVPPVQFSDYDTAEHRSVGEVGADTEEILSEAGYSPEEIAHLRECGAIR